MELLDYYKFFFLCVKMLEYFIHLGFQLYMKESQSRFAFDVMSRIYSKQCYTHSCVSGVHPTVPEIIVFQN